MSSPYYKNFAEKVIELNNRLTKNTICIGIDEDAVHEYSARCSVFENDSKCGTMLLYYSPTKNSFKADVRKITVQEIREKIENLFEAGKVETKKEVHKPAEISKGLYAYVDGSYIHKRIGFGAVILSNGEIIAEFSGQVTDPTYQHARQVSGELMAVGKVVQWCITNNIKEIAIYYDYEGIEHWVTGKWKAKQILTQRYSDYVRKSQVKIYWKKVAAHTGVYWNEYVDVLAKNGAQQIV